MVTALVIMSIAVAVPVALVVIVPVVILAAAVPCTSTASTSTAIPASATILRQCRKSEASPQGRVRGTRDPRLHRLLALHRSEAHFRRCPALLVGGGGRGGDTSGSGSRLPTRPLWPSPETGLSPVGWPGSSRSPDPQPG
jgi:hypothetical protein